ncbi:MAG: cyclase family protein [Myxococcales bacterium]|nr:cyclase family protein [Myxococcales bacterium]
MDRVRALAKKVSNWGRWGPDDELGTLNFITDAVVRKAAGSVKTGRVFSLGLPFNAQGPQAGTVPGRFNPVHTMSLIGERVGEFCYNDDMVVMPLQCGTQWDALSHVFYDGKMYNDRVVDEHVTHHGAAHNSIDKVAEKGVVSRGVLLDMARHAGVERLGGGHLITPADLEAAEKKQGVRVESGDVLLLRTGWIQIFTVDGDRMTYMTQEPGLGMAAIEWLRAREVAAIAADTIAVEVMPCEHEDLPFPFHLLAIRDLGPTLGEMFDLEALAADCAADGQWTFLFSAPALKVTGGIGTPLNPLAVK